MRWPKYAESGHPRGNKLIQVRSTGVELYTSLVQLEYDARVAGIRLLKLEGSRPCGFEPLAQLHKRSTKYVSKRPTIPRFGTRSS